MRVMHRLEAAKAERLRVVFYGIFGLIAACSSTAGTRGPGGAAGAGGTSEAGGGANQPSRRVPAEPADEAALLELAAWTDLPTFRPGRYLQITSTDRETMLFPPVPPGNRDNNNYVCRGQEAVVAADPNGPISVDFPTCPETYVKGLVAARVEGSGRLSRIWLGDLDLTAGGAVEDAVIRIYVDDDPTPYIEVTFGDAKTPPATLEIFAPPFGANTDNNLAWYYPVVFSKKFILSIDNVPNNLIWYQANFVLDDQPTKHQRSAERLPARDEAKALLGRTAAGPLPTATPLVPPTSVSLPSNLPTTVATLTGPATVHSFRVRVPDTAVTTLNAIDIAVTWDAETTPAIAMSLGDLFSSAAGMADKPSASLALALTRTAGETTLDLRLPMPFSSKAVVVLTNRGTPTNLEVAIDGLPSLPADPWGHLVAVRSETAGPTTNPYHPIVRASGPGRLVGVCLMAQGHSSPIIQPFILGPLNFLEGDERLEIDGRTLRGTGTEDYFNGAFYFDYETPGFPFAQWGGMREDFANDKGKVSACRWHVLGGAIDFHESLDLSLEIGPGDPASLDRYVTTAFLYRPRSETQ